MEVSRIRVRSAVQLFMVWSCFADGDSGMTRSCGAVFAGQYEWGVQDRGLRRGTIRARRNRA